MQTSSIFSGFSKLCFSSVKLTGDLAVEIQKFVHVINILFN